jgi:transcriptional regulator with XRE-family HTH domain
MQPHPETPGARLALLMRRRGWSAPRLAEIAGGVSASSIRAYVADRATPRPDHALAVATALGPVDGKDLLEAWGLHDLAEGFYEQWRAGGDDGRLERYTRAFYRLNRLEYPGGPLSESGRDMAQAVVAWIQYVESTSSRLPRQKRHPTLPPDTTKQD